MLPLPGGKGHLNETGQIIDTTGLVGWDICIPRTARLAPGGMVFHVLNRGVGRMRLFLKDGDFEGFERCGAKTLQTRPMRMLV